MYSTVVISLQANPALTVLNFRLRQRPLDSRTRTTRKTRFDLKKKRQPGKLHFTSFTRKVNTVIFVLKEVKPSPNHKMIQLRKHLLT